jgi:hypothetical protein
LPSSRDNEAVEANPPTNPEAFAELVMKLEGVGSGNPEMFMPVLEIVLAAFEAVGAEVPSSSPLD